MLPDIAALLAQLDSPRLQALAAELEEHAQVAHLLASAVAPQPPLKLSDGGAIASDYDAELDELRRLPTNADQFLIDLDEQRERESSGIGTLKVGYNRVHGSDHRDQQGPGGQGAAALQPPPDPGQRRALHHRGAEVVRGQGAVGARAPLSREKLLHEEAARRARRTPRTALKRCAGALSELIDAGAASPSARKRWTGRSRMLETAPCLAHRARPPSVAEAVREQPLETQRPRPAPRSPDAGDHRPQQGGKSTYMRQNALIVLLAHIGSYVPARGAR